MYLSHVANSSELQLGVELLCNGLTENGGQDVDHRNLKGENARHKMKDRIARRKMQNRHHRGIHRKLQFIRTKTVVTCKIKLL